MKLIHTIDHVYIYRKLQHYWFSCYCYSNAHRYSCISIIIHLSALKNLLLQCFQASVLLERKVGPFFVKVPCVDNFGSCTYNNVCELWAEYCPTYAAQYGLPCQCPIPPDTYSVSNANILVNKHVPAELLGEYRATVDVRSSEGHLACIFIDITIRP